MGRELEGSNPRPSASVDVRKSRTVRFREERGTPVIDGEIIRLVRGRWMGGEYGVVPCPGCPDPLVRVGNPTNVCGNVLQLRGEDLWSRLSLMGWRHRQKNFWKASWSN